MRFLQTNAANALFFNTASKDQCTVSLLFDRLGKRKKLLNAFRRRIRNYLLSQFYVSYAGFVDAHRVRDVNPYRMIIFGIRHERLPMLYSAAAEQYIMHSWFNMPDKDCISVFFMKESASLLHEKAWATVFPRWVAFRKFDFLIGLKDGDEQSAIIYPQLYAAIRRSRTPEEMRKEFVRIYDRSIARLALQKPYNREDMRLMVYKLQSNSENIECK